MALTNLEIRNAKAGMHSDGNGLYLCVKPSGSRSWVLRFQLNQRRQDMGLGSLAVLSAAEARAEAARLKAGIANGVNPIQRRLEVSKAHADALEIQAKEHASKVATFKFAAEQHIADKEAGWRNAKHRQQWTNTLVTYVFPTLGDRPVSDITPQHVLEVLRPIWSTKPETASRVRMRIEAVLNSAKLKGWRTAENPAIWRGGLEAGLPAISKVKRVRHHPALRWQDAPAFMECLSEREGVSAHALEFCILTAARSGEVRKATWGEFDLNEALWIVPADKMKAGREHRVPLSDAALDVLKAMPRLEGCDLLFPGMRNQPLSDMSLGAVLKRMSFAQYTVHGFRSTFRDWAAEETNHPSEVVEMALAHTIPNKAEAAYRRGDLLQKRRTLMDDWARYLR
jgi:integrase